MLIVRSYGPLVKGLVDSAAASMNLQGSCRSLRNGMYSGIQQLSVRPGTQLAITLKDDAGTPAPVTSVRTIVPFADGSLVIGYSSTTQKCYLYRLDASLTGYYNTSGTFTTSTTALPIKVLWTGMTTAPDVMIAEGLGTAYIAHTAAADSAGLYWPTKAYTDFNTLASLAASGTDGSSAGSDTAYFLGVISFEQALVGWGYGAGAIASTGYRPELLRYSPPSFGNLQVSDSLTVGDRVRSQRERIIGAGLAGSALIVGASNFISRLTGFGRDSWYKLPVDRTYGMVGPKAVLSAGDTCYYWARRGLVRITEAGSPEPLWDAIPATVDAIVNTSRIVLGFDPDRDQVLCGYDAGNGVNTFAAFDVRRDVWLGPDNELGIVVACMGTVEPYIASTTTPPSGPAGDPTSASTANVGQTTALATWVDGDLQAQTIVEIAPQSTGVYTVVATMPAGATVYTFTGLVSGVPYQWRVRHTLYGGYSAYLGPSGATMFTTTTTPDTLQPPSGLVAFAASPIKRFDLSWTNSGESGVSTEVHRSSDGVSFVAVQTLREGVSSTSDTVASYGTYYYKVRHTNGIITSDFSNIASDTVSDLA